MDGCTTTSNPRCRVLEVQKLALLIEEVRFLFHVEVAFAREFAFLGHAALCVLDLELRGGVGPRKVAWIICHQTGVYELS